MGKAYFYTVSKPDGLPEEGVLGIADLKCEFVREENAPSWARSAGAKRNIALLRADLMQISERYGDGSRADGIESALGGGYMFHYPDGSTVKLSEKQIRAYGHEERFPAYLFVKEWIASSPRSDLLEHVGLREGEILTYKSLLTSAQCIAEEAYGRGRRADGESETVFALMVSAWPARKGCSVFYEIINGDLP